MVKFALKLYVWPTLVFTWRNKLENWKSVKEVLCLLCSTYKHVAAASNEWSDCSLTVKDSWEAPKDSRVPRGSVSLPYVRLHRWISLTPTVAFHWPLTPDIICTVTNPQPMHLDKKSPPSCLIFFFSIFPAKTKYGNPGICRFQLAGCGGMQGFDGRKYSHSH